MPYRLTPILWSLVALGLAIRSVSGASIAPVSENTALQKDGVITDSAVAAEQIWLVSTRHIPLACVTTATLPELDVRNYESSTGLREASLAELLAAGRPEEHTVVYVHGNRFDWNDAVEYGRLANDRLRAGPDAPPVRFVAWSWPSDRIPGMLRDVRAKAQRAHCEAQYLAKFLSEIQSDKPIALIGSSFGARVITGALHLVGGGRLNGHTEGRVVPRLPFRVVLMAAAVNNDWLLPGRYHGRAFLQTDKALVLYNSCDPVLKRYHFLEKCRRPRALGFTGLATCGGLPEHVAQRDVCCVVGRSHREANYFCSSGLMDLARRCFFEEPAD